MRTHMTPSSTSSSMISGIPASVSYFESFGTRYIATLKKAVEQIAKEYEAKIRVQARESWGELADHIKVAVGPDLRLNFSIEEGYEDLAVEKEYGTPGGAPAAVLRMAAINANNELSERINDLIAKGLS